MSRLTTRFVCQKCGHETARWLGRCPDCGEWNTHLEETAPAAPGSRASASGSTSHRDPPRPIEEVPMDSWVRTSSGIGELDRVLGGGVVPGSLVLIGGDPGIGKSTLLMQASRGLAGGSGRVLYVTGEESAQQVRLRADRLGAVVPELFLAAETDLDVIEGHVRSLRPAFLVVDSVQTAHDPALESAPATVSQVRACGVRFMQLAKSTGTTVFLVGHVTKEGTIAGPRVLEHLVDTVLYFEGERFQAYRVLRAVKNRFGSTDEIGLFEMTDSGLHEVAGASELFLSERPLEAPGSTVACVMEGTRPLLVEVQALVTRSYLASPRRTTTGVDAHRAGMLLAVLEKRCGLRMGDRDVFLNVAGGLRISEPALDLAIAAALASSHRNSPVPPEVMMAGEVGLAGEVRAVHQLDRRLREAARMGFTRALVAAGAAREPDGLKAEGVRTLREALDRILPQPAAGPDEIFE